MRSELTWVDTTRSGRGAGRETWTASTVTLTLTVTRHTDAPADEWVGIITWRPAMKLLTPELRAMCAGRATLLDRAKLGTDLDAAKRRIERYLLEISSELAADVQAMYRSG